MLEDAFSNPATSFQTVSSSTYNQCKRATRKRLLLFPLVTNTNLDSNARFPRQRYLTSKFMVTIDLRNRGGEGEFNDQNSAQQDGYNSKQIIWWKILDHLHLSRIYIQKRNHCRSQLRYHWVASFRCRSFEDFPNTLLLELFWEMVETPSLQKYVFYVLQLRFVFSVYLNQNLLDLLILYFLQVSFLNFFVKRKKQCIGEWSSLLGYHLQKIIRQVLN